MLDRIFQSDSRRLPLVHQTELAECGLACLAMVGNYHGHQLDLAGLRRRFPASIKGATLAQLMYVADKLGLKSRPLRVDMEYLAQLKTPCILHWNMNHFVVLKSVSRRGIEIHDPAAGARRMSLDEASESFTGIALELAPTSEFKPERQRTPLSVRTLVGHITGLPRLVSQILLLAVILEALTLATPLALQWVLDHVLTAADYSLLTLLGIGFLAVCIFQAVTLAIRGWIVAGAGASITSQWTANLFGHLMRLPLIFFEKRSVGEVMSRFTSVQMIQHTLTGSFIEALLDGITVVLVLLVLLAYSPTLTLLVAAAMLVYCMARAALYRYGLRLQDERLTHVARQQSHMLESLHGAMSIKLANKQVERYSRVANVSVDVAQRDAAIQRLDFLFSAFSKLVFGVQRVALIWIGTWMTLKGSFTVGMMVVYVAYADMFATRASTLIDRWIDLRLLGLHAQRIADIALQAPEQHTDTGYVRPAINPRIEVSGLGFRYADDDEWVLRDCSFQVEPGDSVAITGASGCGKTTLAKLLLGLLEPSEGIIKVDGVDIRRFGLDAYRALFGTVMQDDKLFAGSIADNIAFFDADSSLARIEKTARMAQIHDDIVAMPMGYETLVGDMGAALSGGQRQRVLFARALYREPSILLLDEATSHLDAEREAAINGEVSALSVTRILIAHRPSTIASAARVLRLSAGQITEIRNGHAQVLDRHPSGRSQCAEELGGTLA